MKDNKRHPVLWRQVHLQSFSVLFFVFSTEGKVYMHPIVRSHYMLVCVDKSEIMT